MRTMPNIFLSPKTALLTLINLILLFTACMNYKQDSNLRSIALTDLQPSPEASETVSFPAQDNPRGDILINVGETANYQGLALTGPYITLAAGEYDLRISYTAASGEALCEVYSGAFINEDNSAGKVLASAVMPAGDDTCVIHYGADTRLRNVEFKIYTDGSELQIHSIENQRSGNFTDAFVILALIWLFEAVTLILWYYCHRSGAKKLALVWNFILLTVLALIAAIPALNDFQAVSHDYLFHYARINGITEWLRSSSLTSPVMRISATDHEGYGYITPIMYPQLFLFIPAFLRLAGCSMLNAYKILIFLINCITAYIAYFSYTRIFKSRQIGMLSAVLYVMGIYRLADIYTRGALGEFIAMAFLPLLLYGMYEILYGDCRKWMYAFAGFTGIIQSHIITVLIAAVCCTLAVLLSIRLLINNRKRIRALLYAALSTILCNLWFLVPFLEYSLLDLNAKEPETRLHSTGIYLSQMFATFVKNGGPMYETGTTAGEMPLTVGTIPLIGSLFFIHYALTYGKFSKEPCRKGICCLGAGAAVLFASSVYFPWQLILSTRPGSHFNIQYLCRLLTIACLFLYPVTAIGLRHMMFSIVRRRNSACILVLTGIVVYTSFYSIDSCLEQEGVNKIYCEVMEKSDRMYLLRSANPDAVTYSGTLTCSEDLTAQIQNYRREYAGLKAELSIAGCTENSYIDLPLFYYPDYQALDQNGAKLPIAPSPDGLIRLTPSDSLTSIHVYYKEPLHWSICTVISLLSLLFLCAKKIRASRNR